MDDKVYLTSEMTSKHREADALKKVAFAGVALSTTAILCAVLVVPMLYNHMQMVHSALQTEVDYCKSQSSTLRQELGRTRVLVGGPNAEHRRVAREWGDQDATYGRQAERPYGDEAYNAATDAPVTGSPQTQFLSSCCTCQQGRAGVAGPVGADGRDGQDGASGSDGPAGDDGGYLTYNPCFGKPCFECAEALQGDAGARGAQGPKGPTGDSGLDADGGIRGADGPVGRRGLAGARGLSGKPGVFGEDGVMRIVDAPVGPPGMMGEPGSKGPTGRDGPDGRAPDGGVRGELGNSGDAGPDGSPGVGGLPGLTGLHGEVGTCTHCPPPRTAPGY